MPEWFISGRCVVAIVLSVVGIAIMALVCWCRDRRLTAKLRGVFFLIAEEVTLRDAIIAQMEKRGMICLQKSPNINAGKPVITIAEVDAFYEIGIVGYYFTIRGIDESISGIVTAAAQMVSDYNMEELASHLEVAA